MKGKLPIILSALIALVTVLGLVSALVPTVVSADTATDTINPIQMPTPGAGNLAYYTTPVAIAQAVDGTLFAAVRDDSKLDGNYSRWHIAQGNRQFAVFTSADGYKWTQGYIVPCDDNITTATGDDPIIAIVPVPDYSKNNTVVYMATNKFIYVSTNGGKNFNRMDQVPGVTYNNATTCITSIDVAANPTAGQGYVVVVGTSGPNSGVFTYNENGYQAWKDKYIGNDAYTVKDYDVLAVKFSTGYTANNDKVILAVFANVTSGAGDLTVRGTSGVWGVDALDAITLVGATSGSTVKIALPSDFNPTSNAVSYVLTSTRVYRINSILSPGAPSIKTLLSTATYTTDTFCDIVVTGSGSNTQCMVAMANTSGDDGIQVLSCTNPGGFALAWIPSYKQPAGGNSAALASGPTGTFVACGAANMMPSGVYKMVVGYNGNIAWNGVGLIDTVISTADYARAGSSTSTIVCGPFWTVASPNNKNDNTIYMISWVTGDDRPMMVWRSSTNGATWDMIAQERLPMGEGSISDMYSAVLADSGIASLADQAYIFTLQTSPTFSNGANSTDQNVFMMGNSVEKNAQWIFRSQDAGNTWKPIIAMPPTLDTPFSMTSWCVVNPTTYIVADDAGKVFMTTNAGVSWTDGAVTEDDALVTSLKFFADPTLGTVILAGTADSDGICKAFISTNNCTSFTQIGTPIGTITAKGPTPLVQVGFDNLFSTNHIVYAAFGGEFDHWITTADTTGANSWIKANQYDAGIVRSTVSIADPTSSTLWKKIVSQSDFSGMLPAINGSAGTDNTTRYLFTTGLAVGPQDTLYVTLGCYDSAQDAIVCGGFIRCLDGTVATPKFDFTDSNLLGYGALWTANVVPGSSNLFTIGAALGNDGNLHLRLLNYIDTLASKAGSMVPVSGATAQGTISGGLVNVPLSWGGISGTSYKWQVALDSNFDSIVKEGTATTAAAIVSGLQTGTPYYWRVKVTAPAEGPWSAAASFTTASTVSGAPQLISPANGDTISDTKPLFAWNPVAGATSYNIKVATDATFTAITEQATVNTNSYATPTKLADGVYYWEVTATVGSTTTAPGNSVFQINSSTTSNAPQSWVWVLIALGVVLAIFVLVLILRTRRPV